MTNLTTSLLEGLERMETISAEAAHQGEAQKANGFLRAETILGVPVIRLDPPAPIREEGSEPRLLTVTYRHA